MKNDQEKENRRHLLFYENQRSVKLRPTRKEIDSVVYDTGDSETRLIGEINVHYTNYLKQLWRTKDGHYFFYSYSGVREIEPIDVEDAHADMNREASYRRFLTDAQKKELEEEDERLG